MFLEGLEEGKINHGLCLHNYTLLVIYNLLHYFVIYLIFKHQTIANDFSRDVVVYHNNCTYCIVL